MGIGLRLCCVTVLRFLLSSFLNLLIAIFHGVFLVLATKVEGAFFLRLPNSSFAAQAATICRNVSLCQGRFVMSFSKPSLQS